MTDLQKLTLEQLGTAFRNSDYGDGRPAHTIEQFCAELRRRDEATRKLVEAANRVILWMDDNGYRPDDQSFGLRDALAQFPKE
jgi:hypothetical protein